MKTLASSFAAMAIMVGSAFAADLPSRKGPPVLPPPPPPPMWTGFYAGLNAGYGFGTNSNVQSYAIAQDTLAGYGLSGWDPLWNTFTPQNQRESWMNYFYLPQMNNPIYGSNGTGGAQTVSFANTQSGFVGGGQVGYNYQWGSQFVIGVEADIQGSGIRGSNSGTGLGAGSTGFPSFNVQCKPGSWEYGCDTFGQSNPTYQGYAGLASGSNALGVTSVNAGVDWLGTVRGRLGYLVTPTMLIYGTGGLTYGGVHASVRQAAITSTSAELLPYTITNIYAHANDFVQMPGASLGGFTQTYVGGGSKSQTLVGWNAGGGLEWMFMPNWSLKAEAIYWNMGNMNVQTFTAAAAPVNQQGGTAQPNNSVGTTYGSTRVNYQGVIARAGVNYHFNWGGSAPVVAAY